ncbi:hypothetical protein F4802DRAFT_605491 [Xylaria palmicola]|nr:hypothetical protein F4802DRAFT_605491 [Xylaria palmicola]
MLANVHSVSLRVETDDGQDLGIDCMWQGVRTPTPASGSDTPVQTVDVFFSARPYSRPPSGADYPLPSRLRLQVAALNFLNKCFCAAAGAMNSGVVAARFIIPLQAGTVIKSDILSSRLRDAYWVEKVVSFASPLRVFQASRLSSDTRSLAEIFDASAGAVLLKPSTTQHLMRTSTGLSTALPSEIEADFGNKLSIAWISAAPVARKRLVLVGSSNQDPEGGGWTQFAFRAAASLGIDLVIVDREDGWLSRGDYASQYEALLPAPAWWWAEPSVGALVKFVEDYKTKNPGKTIDGMATFIEALQVPVSVAASRLGLPHEQTSAFSQATNKYKLGLFQNRCALLASNTADVLAGVASRDNDLAFPLIVKPCFGLNSEGVTRVNEESELEEAIEAARASGRSKSDVGDQVLVERYCDGPEVDVNLVLVGGRVLFAEICDDFPKGADVDDPAGAAAAPGQRRNFQETNMVFPSALPDDEKEALRDAVVGTIRGLGFENGVMHVEARVASSKCSYQRSANGVVDLRPRGGGGGGGGGEPAADDDAPPTPWVIEVNPRPPGLFASQTPASVYGIDYWAISLLLGVGDRARAGALARPFAGGAQSHTVLVMIRAEFDPAREGVFDSDDVCAELLARHPELAPHLGRYGCLLKRGQRIPHPSGGRNTFVAYINVFSRTSRQEALEVAKKVREEIRYEIR